MMPAHSIIHGDSRYPMVLVPGGRLVMGTPDDEEGRDDNEGPVHEVELAPFYLGRHPVTQEEYGRCLAVNPGMRRPVVFDPDVSFEALWGLDLELRGPRHPVVDVTWEEAEAFCRWAGLVLPTEAQWEHACRAGTRSRYWSGDAEEDLARVGWYAGNASMGTKPVESKPANAFGLHDMHGNVVEWCQDWYDPGAYRASARSGDGLRTPEAEKYRTSRGGAWGCSARVARSGYRGYGPTRVGSPIIGFRCALPLDEVRAT
jgi:formylglycine-generating enzyme required for sulfatase activity